MIPILYPVNLLAPPSYMVTSGAAVGFPNRRLSDGDIGLLWKDSATGLRDILVDQGATGTQSVDTLILAAGHNWGGLSVTVSSGPTQGSLTTRATFTVGDGLHRQTMPLRFDRWWLIRVANASVAPHAPEMVLSLALALPASPTLRGQEVGQLSNVLDLESYGGATWSLVRGPVRWTSIYPVLAMTRAQRDALCAAHAALDGGARPCYLTDVDGITRWVSWTDRHLRFAAPLPDRYDVALSFREVLGAA